MYGLLPAILNIYHENTTMKERLMQCKPAAFLILARSFVPSPIPTHSLPGADHLQPLPFPTAHPALLVAHLLPISVSQSWVCAPSQAERKTETNLSCPLLAVCCPRLREPPCSLWICSETLSRSWPRPARGVSSSPG